MERTQYNGTKYNRFVNLDGSEDRIIYWLLSPNNKNKQELEQTHIIWKLLMYNDCDALKRETPSYFDVIKLISNDDILQADKRIFRHARLEDGFTEQCTILKVYVDSIIPQNAYTAQVMSDLGALPAAIAACKGLLAESPNFKKLGDSIKRIFKDMQKPEAEISKLNDILEEALSPKPAITLASRLDGTANDEVSDQFKAEYAAMVERIKGKVATEPVAKPITAADDATGDIDYADLIEEENRKK